MSFSEGVSERNLCPKCKDTGWILYDNNGYEMTKECECGKYKKELFKNRKTFANLPEAYKDIKLEDVKTDVYTMEKSKATLKLALKGINYWIQNIDSMKKSGRGLYIHSNSKGSGKTKTAAGIANKLIELNNQVLFATSVQILSEIKASWDKDNYKHETESKLLHRLSNTDILVLDDFGTEEVKGWISEKFYQIINNRYSENKITIFTSNLKVGDLKYDERIIDRIKECTYQIPFPEESVRDKIAQHNLEELIMNIKD